VANDGFVLIVEKDVEMLGACTTLLDSLFHTVIILTEKKSVQASTPLDRIY